MNKGFYSIFALIVFSSLFSCADKSSKITTPPNILFIMSDDHTSQAWGIYGGILAEYAQNDNIRRIADEGAILQNVFCTNSICVPSRASIMTGKYSHRNGVFTLNDSLKHDQASISSSLQGLGYETAIIGKWHLKEIPLGFDHVNVLPGQGLYWNPSFRNPDNWNEKSEWIQYEGFSSDIIADLSLEWLDNRAEDQPFFLMTHFKATHEPFDYPDRFDTLFQDEFMPEPATLMGHEEKAFAGQQLEILGQRFENDSKKEISRQRYPGLPVEFEQDNEMLRRSQIYQKFIKDFLRSGAAINDNIGRILDYLDEKDLADNTVVIYTSDQGYFLGEHGFFDKRIMYEEALRMPFVIRYPKEIKAGSSIDEMVLNHDFPALFADYAGSKSDRFSEGRSFRGLLKGEDVSDWRSEMYYRYWQHLDIRPAHFGIRTKTQKLIYFYGDPLGKKGTMPVRTEPFWEYYDLEDDPEEDNNLIGEVGRKLEIEELKRKLLSLQLEVGDRRIESSQ